jgi:hypothetical protein
MTVRFLGLVLLHVLVEDFLLLFIVELGGGEGLPGLDLSLPNSL